MNSALTATATKRGRPSAESPSEKVARLERELHAARLSAKESELRRAAIVGNALLAEAAQDGELKSRIADILRRRVTGGAKADIAPLLI